MSMSQLRIRICRFSIRCILNVYGYRKRLEALRINVSTDPYTEYTVKSEHTLLYLYGVCAKQVKRVRAHECIYTPYMPYIPYTAYLKAL